MERRKGKLMGQLIIKYKKETKKVENAARQRHFNDATKSDNTIQTISSETPSQSAQGIFDSLSESGDKKSPEEVICCGS